MIFEPGLHGISYFDIVLFVRTGMEIKRCASGSIMICIIHKHHLAVTIGMYKRQKLDAVHLEEKFAHVGTCEG